MRLFFLSRNQMGKMAVLILFLIVAGIGIYGFQTVHDYQVISSENIGIFRGNPNQKAMALTFNVDWGEKEIPKILEILKDNNIKATFYLTGRWTEKFPQIAKKIAEEEHEIGNHGYFHKHVDRLSIKDNIVEIKNAEKIITKVTGQKPVIYTPPYGIKTEHVIKAASKAGYITVYWTVDTIDWKKERTPEQIANKVINNAQNGAIVLMHPVTNTVKALPKIISKLKDLGYNFVTVSEIIG